MKLSLVISVAVIGATSVVAADRTTAKPRPAVELRGGKGYSRLVQPGLAVQKGEYDFSCLLSDDVRFQQHDHVPGLWNITPDVTRSDARYERQPDGWIRYSCRVVVPNEGKHDFVVSLWGHESMQFASLSLQRVDSDVELLQNPNFANGTSNWTSNGGSLTWHRAQLPVPPRPRLTGQKVTYTTFQGKKETLNGFEGDELILLTPDAPAYTTSQVEALLSKLQRSWKYYSATIGKLPMERVTQLRINGRDYHNSKPVLAVVHETCGAGCGMVGSCGIETVPSIWEQIWQKHLAGKETRGLFEYEMGRNFWMFHDQLHAPDVPEYHLATAFATVFGFKAGVAAGSTTDKGTELVDWTNSFRTAFDDYLASPDFSILTKGGQRAEKIQGGLWLYLGDKYGEEFYHRYFRELTMQPAARDLREAVHHHVRACSAGAGEDLSVWFHETLMYPQ